MVIVSPESLIILEPPAPHEPAAAVEATNHEPLTRRRGATLEQAIFDAALAELVSVGLAGVTMDRVAAAAHTGKAALYRRWPSKEELLVDAIDHMLPPCQEPADTGTLRDDLVEFFRTLATMLNSPTGCAVKLMMAELDPDDDFVRLVDERVVQPRKQVMSTIVARAVERGEARADASPLCYEAGPALLFQRVVTFCRSPGSAPAIDDEFVRAIVDEVTLPLLRCGTTT